MYSIMLICCHCSHINNLTGWVTIIPIVIALVAIYFSARFQMITSVNSQLIEIAKVCNSYLQEGYQVNKDGKISQGRASGIVTALEDAEKIINFYSKKWYIFYLDKETFRRCFYFNLHSSIRDFLKREIEFNTEESNRIDNIINDQLHNARIFLRKEIDETIKSENERVARLDVK